MYIVKKDFQTYLYGMLKKGQEAPFNQAWIDAGLIEKKTGETETKPKKTALETKPAIKKTAVK